jgi:hypothetical protein
MGHHIIKCRLEFAGKGTYFGTGYEKIASDID